MYTPYSPQVYFLFWCFFSSSTPLQPVHKKVTTTTRYKKNMADQFHPQFCMVNMNRCQFCMKTGPDDMMEQFRSSTFRDTHSDGPIGMYVTCASCKQTMEESRVLRALSYGEVPSHLVNVVLSVGSFGISSEETEVTICCIRQSSSVDDLVLFVHSIKRKGNIGCVPFYFSKQSDKVRQFIISALSSVPQPVKTALKIKSPVFDMLFETLSEEFDNTTVVSCDDLVFYN